MIFIKSLNSKIDSFICNVDRDILKKFTIGFYQLLNSEVVDGYDWDMDLLDKKGLIYFLENVKSLEDAVFHAKPSEELAFFLTYMGHIYASSVMLEESLPLYQESIKVRERYLNVKSLLTAENYQSIGSVYEQLGEFDKALAYYKRSLSIRKELSYVANNLLIAESYHRIALAYYYLDYYDLALEHIDETIRIRERILPPMHTLLENAYYNYAIIERASQPRRDYLGMLFDPIRYILNVIMSRLVG
jgi:tetratricopeptide (TPR) repeat protein